MAKLIARKIANAFIGGLWVGGDAKLFDDHLQFEPNALNRVFNAGDLAVNIPLSAVEAVSRRWGFVTSIVDVTYLGSRVSFRCWGLEGLRGRHPTRGDRR